MSNVSEPSQNTSQRVSPVDTANRRRATFAILVITMLGALFVARPSDEPSDDVVAVGATAPVGFASAVAAIPGAIELDPTTTESTIDAGADSDVASLDVAAESASTTAAPSTTSTEPTPAAASDTAERVAETPTTSPPTTAAPPPPPPTTAPPTTVAPTTTTTEAPPPPPSSGDPESIIREIFGAHGDDAVTIARCESSLNPGAYNPAGYYGLFQIGSGHAPRFESVTGTSWENGRYDARANTTYAKWLFDGDGQTWRQWGCRHRL